MSDADERNGAISEAVEAAKALSGLSSDPDLFQKALDAFRGQDADAFHATLDQVGLLPLCRRICDWFCSKDCVIRCLTLAGPPPKSFDEVAEPGEFADVVARITGDEAVLRRLVEVVERTDVDGSPSVRRSSPTWSRRWTGWTSRRSATWCASSNCSASASSSATGCASCAAIGSASASARRYRPRSTHRPWTPVPRQVRCRLARRPPAR